MYVFYVDTVRLPVTPAAITTRYRGRHETVALNDGGEATFLRPGEGAELQFRALLPRTRYPFSRYTRRFIPPEMLLEELLSLHRVGRAFRFLMVRLSPAGEPLGDLNLRATLSALTVSEDAEDGGDIAVELTIREYREHTATRVSIDNLTVTVPQQKERESDNAPRASSYTVQPGDSLWSIARRYLGDGARYTEIFALNREQIQHPNLIHPGQVLVMPER